MHLTSPAAWRAIASSHRRWVVCGPPGSGVSAALAARVARLLAEGCAPERVLALAADRRAARETARALAAAGAAGVQPEGYVAFAQKLVQRHWPLAAAWLGSEAPEPVFLAFDLAQYTCREEYRRDPGGLARLTIREQRLIVQLLDNMNLAAANGLTLQEAWARVAAGLGVGLDDPAIQAGARITAAFRARCIVAGALPFDLQIETAAWLLAQPEVLERLGRRYRLVLVDGLDEVVPAMARAICRLATIVPDVLIGVSSDGGLRWMLGASARAAEQECRRLLAVGGFRCARLAAPDPHGMLATARRVAHLLTADGGGTPPAPPRWSLDESPRLDHMARAAVVAALALLDDGVPPEEIVLLTPSLDPVVAGELTRAFADQEAPFRIERRWRSLIDDPATRACLTALRLAAPSPGRPASLVELADLLTTLLGANPVAAQRLANVMYDTEENALRPLAAIQRRLAEARVDPLPPCAERLVQWVTSGRGDEPLHQRLAALATDVLPGADAAGRGRLLAGCRALTTIVERFIASAPRLGVVPPYLDEFLAVVDSGVIAADDPPDEADPALVLTTPYAFLTTGRGVRRQFWLDAGSPNWWEPPLLLLTNPHALGDDADVLPFTLEHEDQVRARVLGRVIRNLAARVTEGVHIFAAHTGPDGEPLDGPLLHALRAAGIREGAG